MSVLNKNDCYQALLARDVRFDGCFFTCVTTTKIYCRPLCTAKTPQAENCFFVTLAAEAEAKGFRPCLRCRPELAPGMSSIEATYRLARHVKQLLDDGFLSDSDEVELAMHLNVSARHVRRVFKDEFGISLVSYLQTKRLLIAKQLLTETHLPITEIAFASGFSSLRRFNALFKENYRMAPSTLQKSKTRENQAKHLDILIPYRPPFSWTTHLEFLKMRAVGGVESIYDDSYFRSVKINHGKKVVCGWIAVTCDQKRNALKLRVDPILTQYFPAILVRVKHLFDVNCRPDLIEAVLGENLVQQKGLRLPGSFDGFEMAIRAIMGQQVTVKDASTLTSRLVAKFGTEFDSPFKGVTHIFPQAQMIAAVPAESIRQIGIPLPRAKAIVALALAVASGELRLEPGENVEEQMRRLNSLPGIGLWTAQYIAMRALAWPDAFLPTDLGVLKSLQTRNAKEAEIISEAWKPWRSYAVMHLWHRISQPKKLEKRK